MPPVREGCFRAPIRPERPGRGRAGAGARTRLAGPGGARAVWENESAGLVDFIICVTQSEQTTGLVFVTMRKTYVGYNPGYWIRDFDESSAMLWRCG